jgi:hypothetical protein
VRIEAGQDLPPPSQQVSFFFLFHPVRGHCLQQQAIRSFLVTKVKEQQASFTFQATIKVTKVILSNHDDYQSYESFAVDDHIGRCVGSK